MKLTIRLLCLLFISSFFQCTVDEDDEPDMNDNNTGATYTVSYKNQTLSGKINGIDWTIVGGKVSKFSNFSFSLVDTVGSDPCIQPFNRKSRIIFSLEDNSQVLPVGEYPLKLDFQNTAGNRTVTLVHYNGTTPVNTIMDKGAYEILSVDTSNNIVTGRMDAYYDDGHFVNGNFSITYCR